jgi:hypothetical protein
MSSTYNVVKLRVNVRLIENSVKSHVGRVIVTNVIVQKSAPGMNLRTANMIRPSKPDDGVEASSSASVKAAATELESAAAVAAEAAEAADNLDITASADDCSIAELMLTERPGCLSRPRSTTPEGVQSEFVPFLHWPHSRGVA